MDGLTASLLRKLYEKDPATYWHCIRVSQLATRLGKMMGLDTQSISRILFCARLHDIGKLEVPLEILLSEESMTSEEWAWIRRHPEFGRRIILETFGAAFWREADIIFAHHERVDGTGYPQELPGEKIPIESKVIAIADALDVMVVGRPYKRPMPVDKCILGIEQCAGYQFDQSITSKITVQMIEKYQDSAQYVVPPS